MSENEDQFYNKWLGMNENARQFYFDAWRYGALIADKMGEFTHCLNIANQLRINGAGFDIHIDTVSPHIAGALTTTVGGNRQFHNLEDLKALLYMDWEELRKASKEQNDTES